MSEKPDEHIVSAPILASNRKEGKDAENLLQSDTPALCDLSERDKPWDKHRTNCDVTAGYYQSSEFSKYAERMKECSGLLDFRLVPEAKNGVYRLKLAAARFCKVRHCPVCQWRRSLMWKAKAYKILPQVIENYPNYRWLFVTLTVRNCAITELRETLVWMNNAFKRLSELKAFPAEGYIKTTEVTRGKNPPGSAHPHFHVLMLVRPSYFGVNYLSQAKWVQMWRKSLRVDYNPILDVQALKPQDSLVGLLAEVIKYSVKESDLTTDQEWFLELTRQLHHMKAIAVSGVLRDYMRELEQEPEDFIGEDNQADIDEGHLYFEWKNKQKKYKLIED